MISAELKKYVAKSIHKGGSSAKKPGLKGSIDYAVYTELAKPLGPKVPVKDLASYIKNEVNNYKRKRLSIAKPKPSAGYLIVDRLDSGAKAGFGIDTKTRDVLFFTHQYPVKLGGRYYYYSRGEAYFVLGEYTGKIHTCTTTEYPPEILIRQVASSVSIATDLEDPARSVPFSTEQTTATAQILDRLKELAPPSSAVFFYRHNHFGYISGTTYIESDDETLDPMQVSVASVMSGGRFIIDSLVYGKYRVMKTCLRTDRQTSMGLAIINMETGSLQNLTYPSTGWGGYPEQELQYGYIQAEVDPVSGYLLILTSASSPSSTSVDIKYYEKHISLEPDEEYDTSKWYYTYDQTRQLTIPHIDYTISAYDIQDDNLLYIADAYEDLTGAVTNIDMYGIYPKYGLTTAAFAVANTHENELYVVVEFCGIVVGQFDRDYEEGVVFDNYEPRYAMSQVRVSVSGAGMGTSLTGDDIFFRTHSVGSGRTFKTWVPVDTTQEVHDEAGLPSRHFWECVLAHRELFPTGSHLDDPAQGLLVGYYIFDYPAFLGGSIYEGAHVGEYSGVALNTAAVNYIPRKPFEILLLSVDKAVKPFSVRTANTVFGYGPYNTAWVDIPDTYYGAGLVETSCRIRPASGGYITTHLSRRLANIWWADRFLAHRYMQKPGGGTLEVVLESTALVTGAATYLSGDRIFLVQSRGVSRRVVRRVGSDEDPQPSPIWYVKGVKKLGKVRYDYDVFTPTGTVESDYGTYTAIVRVSSTYPWAHQISEHFESTSSLQRADCWVLPSS